MHEGQQNKKRKLVQNTPNRFLRIRHSENIELLKPQKIITTLKNNQFLFVDFGDEKNVKILEKAEPNESDEETHNIGNNYIAGWKNLSPPSYNMLQYISDNRAFQDHRKSIDDIVKARIRRIQARRKKRQQQASKKKRKNLKNYNVDKSFQTNDNENLKGKVRFNSLKLSDNGQKIQEQIQKANNDLITSILQQGERQLHKSLSSAGNYKKLAKSYSIEIQNLNKRRNQAGSPYSYTNRRNFENNQLSLLKFPEIKKIKYQLRRA